MGHELHDAAGVEQGFHGHPLFFVVFFDHALGEVDFLLRPHHAVLGLFEDDGVVLFLRDPFEDLAQLGHDRLREVALALLDFHLRLAGGRQRVPLVGRPAGRSDVGKANRREAQRRAEVALDVPREVDAVRLPDNGWTQRRQMDPPYEALQNVQQGGMHERHAITPERSSRRTPPWLHGRA